MRLFYFFVTFLLLVTSAHAVDFSVGVSPPVVEVGDVNPGEQKIVKFSIFTVSDENLLVYLDTENGNMDFFNRGYSHLMSNFSEEPTMAWIQFVNNPVEIDVASSKTAGRAWKDVTLVLNVPRNAEPGYHVIKINPRPTVYGSLGTPVGTSIVATTSVSILFNVRGSAKRDGVVLDSTTNGYAGNPFSINTFFQNLGTNTIHARTFIKIYDADKNFLGEFYSPGLYVKPGLVTLFETPVDTGLNEGEYSIESSVIFTTDSAEKNSTIYLYTQQEQPKPAEDNTWIIIFAIAIIIILLALAYRWYSEKR
jgi:hypothetical protein